MTAPLDLAALTAYTADLFAREDAALAAVRERHAAEGLPVIHVSADEGRLLHVLVRAVGARRVLEVGALGGYSGIWIARALGPGGRLTTVEKDPNHAALARRAYAEAGVADRVELVEGAALDVLPRLVPGFDAVFLDADKAPLPRYLELAVPLLRVGGLLLCDNTFLGGDVVRPDVRSADALGMREFNRRVAAHPHLAGSVIPIRDGLLVAVKTGA